MSKIQISVGTTTFEGLITLFNSDEMINLLKKRGVKKVYVSPGK